MTNIKDAVRISKRILLTNLLTNDYNLALTPLLSGKHGIGKSQVAKAIAKSLNGKCITIEGGTLKEGEITGIPYQYTNEYNEIEFKFLPYYVIKRIQETEKILNHEISNETSIDTVLEGDENRYSKNDLTFEEKMEYIEKGKVKPVIIFFDEINRTENAVFKELMNIVLTRTVNGYKFPWWVFIIAAMNPSTQSSIYSTNEMDPAQMDRFIKIKIKEDAGEWINYAVNHNIDSSIVNFISSNEKCLSETNQQLEDTESPTPSPRGWEMISLILNAKDKLDNFFTKEELCELDKDIKTIITSKVGVESATMYYNSLKDKTKVVTSKDIFNFDEEDIGANIKEIIKAQSTARNSITSKDIIDYLVVNLDENKNNKKYISSINKKLKSYIKLLDNSSKLFFTQNIVDAKTEKKTDIYDYISDVFDDKLLELIEFRDRNSMLIGASK